MNSKNDTAEDYKFSMCERLRECRTRSHLTQEKMAELLDISTKHYSEVERGLVGLSVEKLIQLSDILGISLDYLLKGKTRSDNYPLFLIEAYESCPDEKKAYFVKLIESLKHLITMY